MTADKTTLNSLLEELDQLRPQLAELKQAQHKYRQTEKALRESEERYRDLANLLPQSVFEIDARGRISYSNLYGFKFTGYSQEDIDAGLNAVDLFVPEDRERLMSRTMRRLGGEELGPGEYTLLRKDGSTCPIIIYSSVIVQDGKPVGVRGIAADLTLQKENELERQASIERIYRQRISITRLATNPAVVNGDFLGAAQVISELAADILDTERASIWLLTDDELQFECIDLYERSVRRHSSGHVIKMSESPNYFESLKTTRVVDCSDAQKDPRTCEFTNHYLVPLGITSMIDTAIFTSGKLTGIICIEHVGEIRKWKLDEVKFAGELTDHTAHIYSHAERLRTEEALKESEARLKAAVDSMPFDFWIRDNDGCIVMQNAESVKMWGNMHGNVPDDQQLADNTLELWQANNARAMAGEVVSEEVAVTHSGQTRFFHNIIAPVMQGESINGILGLNIDVTARRRAEEMLRYTVEATSATVGRNFFNTMVKHLADALGVRYTMVADLVGDDEDKFRTIAAWNGDRFDENEEYPLAGTPCEHVVGKKTCCYPFRVQELFPEEKTLAKMEVESFLGTPLFSSSGNPIGVLVVMDTKPLPAELVSSASALMSIFASRASIEMERLKAEQSLKESEERLELAVKGADLALWDWHPQTDEVVFSDRWAEMLGYTSDEMDEKNITWESLVHPDDYDRVMEVLNAHMEGRTESYRTEHRVRAKSGEWKWILDKGRIVEWDDEGRPVRFSGTFLDITETRTLRDLSERAQRLETAGKIAGQVAHDFNNLLGPLVAYPELILAGLPEDDRAARLVKSMERAARQMADINQQLLTLGRRGHYNHEPIDVNELIDQALRTLQAEEYGIEVKIDLATDLNSINGGGSQLHRVITNLVSNAKDAMEDGGTLAVTTENIGWQHECTRKGNTPAENCVKITISDTGCGIPANIAESVFDPFFSTKRTDTQRGSGLGLSVVHAVVEDHNGRIDFHSEEGKGTTFCMCFPAITEAIQPVEPTEEIGGTESILVVDDDHEQREVTCLLLEELGYKVDSVSSGEAAIERLRGEAPDLLILDMIMPGGIDGAETYRQALQIHHDQKAIIVSGFAESDRVTEALKLNAGAFVQKPLTMKVISNAVRTELDRAPDDQPVPTA